MAVIKNKKTGMWEVRTYYKDLTGERKQKTKRDFAKKSEALEWERNFKLKENQSISMSFQSFVDIYLTDLEPRIKRNSFLTKKHIIETKILPYFGKRKLTDKQKEIEVAQKEADKWMMITDTAKWQTEQAQMAKKKYADGMLASLQELTGKQALSIYTPTQVAEAWAEQQSQLKAGLQSLQQEIAANEQEQAELEEKLLACPDQTGTTNVLHEDIGKLQFDLSKLEFEDQQVDKKYSRRRLGFVLWIDTPLAIVLSLLVTVGMIDVFFMQAWEAWFRLVTSLIGFEIAFTIIGFCVYNMTKMLRKKLFGTEIPVETHARLQSQIRLLESKIHDLQLEESSRFLDQKNYDENSRRMKEVQKQYQQLLEKSEVILSVLDVNADKMVKE